MARSKGMGFWLNVANKFAGKERLNDKDFAECDKIVDGLKTSQDKEIGAYFDILIENSLQNDWYFGKELLGYAHDVYKNRGS